MTTPSTGIRALQSILDRHLPAGEQNRRIESFHIDLNRHNFRPLPNKFGTLPITAALGRWLDLKKTAQDQLAEAILSRWQIFDAEQRGKTPQTSVPDIAPPEPVAPIENEENTVLVQPISQSTTPVVKAPISYLAPQRDWFDLVTDFVAIFFKPLYDSE